MRVQRTRTKQLRAPLTTTLGHPKSTQLAISTHVRSIINWIIVPIIVTLACTIVQGYNNNCVFKVVFYICQIFNISKLS